MTSDSSEQRSEEVIVRTMTGRADLPLQPMRRRPSTSQPKHRVLPAPAPPGSPSRRWWARATVSRLIREAVEARLVVPYDPEAGRKFMRYVPFWAVSG